MHVDDLAIGVLLNSLPASYQPLVMALDAVGNDLLTLDELIAKLINLKDNVQGFYKKENAFDGDLA
jgi:hypothetical protein